MAVAGTRTEHSLLYAVAGDTCLCTCCCCCCVCHGCSARYIYLRFLLCNLIHLSKRLEHVFLKTLCLFSLSTLAVALLAGCLCLPRLVYVFVCIECAINKVKMSNLCLLKSVPNSTVTDSFYFFKLLNTNCAAQTGNFRFSFANLLKFKVEFYYRLNSPKFLWLAALAGQRENRQNETPANRILNATKKQTTSRANRLSK